MEDKSTLPSSEKDKVAAKGKRVTDKKVEIISVDCEERAIVEKICLIERELKRRKTQDFLSAYNTKRVHHKQVEFHKCKSRNRWVFGGNRSGKTECGAVETVWLATGRHPYRTNKPNVCGWVVSLSFEVQRDVAQKKILHYLKKEDIVDIAMLSGRKGSPEKGVIDYICVKNSFGGVSTISFKSCDQGREKFQGASLDFVWFDEEPPKDIYDECRMRVLDRCGDIFGTMTPLKGLSWVYEDIYLNKGMNKEVWHISMEWADNPYLSVDEVELLSATMDEDSLQSRRYGRFAASYGVVYSEFDPQKHIIEPFDIPFDWKDGIAIDPGLNNPLACLFFAIDYDGRVFVVGEHYAAGQGIDFHAEKIEALANELDWPRDAQGRLCALIDSAARQKTLASERSVCDLFYDKNILVNYKVDKNVFAGISRIKNYLASGKLFIFENCTNLIKEIKTYRWGKEDLPIKKDDHALDALRYYIMSKPAATKLPTPIPTEVERDKNRLIRAKERRKF